MVDIYADAARTTLVDGGQLIENKKYYVDFGGYSNNEPIEIILQSGLDSAISWIPGNSIAELKITNYIGKASIDGANYDIRSNKFLRELSGSDQLSLLAKEIEGMSAGITLSADSPSIANRLLDWEDPSSSDLHQFNYFYQLFFTPLDGLNALELFNSIRSHPHFEYATTSRKEFIWNSRKIDHRFVSRLLMSKSDVVDLSTSPGLSSSVSNALRSNVTGHVSAPLHLEHTRQILSYDTQENRFVKHFFQHIESLCRRVEAAYSKSSLLTFRCQKLLPAVRQCLSDPFFAEIGDINSIPTQSTVLKYRHGYKETAEHYVKSMLGVLPDFDDIAQGITAELKDVATIYEIWCYYIVAKAVLGEEMFLEESRTIIEDGELLFETTLSNDTFSISYNRSFARAKKESYSLTFRPDICITHKSSGSVAVLDAKYKVQFVLDEKREIKSTKYKSDDVHKMHTYVDSIDNCDSAVVLYVGEEFRFFQRGDFSQVHKGASSISTLMGVGVIPLIPGIENVEFEAYIAKLVGELSNNSGSI